VRREDNQVQLLKAQIQALNAQLGQARAKFFALNSAMCGLIKEKFQGRAYVSIPVFAECQGWTLDILPQKALGNVRLTCVDGNGHAQFKAETFTGPACEIEGCGAKAIFASGLDDNGQPVNPRCGAHLPDQAFVDPTRPIEAAVQEEVVEVCPGCGRKVGHNLDCPNKEAA
jgi:hypothetical protein